LSLSQIQKSIVEKRIDLDLFPYDVSKNWNRSLNAFESRLWWHCHFIQKLESEPELEFENVNRAFDGMREDNLNMSFLKAWEKGETGYPIIDACMRALSEKGWINFRMRAMLVSFASYQLWIHWREISHHLAKLFVDFEPGIHFSQLQMQSGVTGINSIRIYSPIKQTEDQDPSGEFIKTYCPELKDLDAKFLAAPWEAPPMILKMADVNLGENYPMPVVDHKEAYKNAKDTIFKWRKKSEVIEEAKRVYQKHGSRKNKNFPNQHRRVFQ
jgi:deoxyribodipyrimidine photo-lyase